MTSPGIFSDYKIHEWLRDFASCWVALHSDSPESAGAYASEIFGGAYIRLHSTFSDPHNRATWNVTALNFTGLPPVILTHLAAWDAQINGNYLASAPLSDPVRVLSGGRYSIPTGNFALSIR